MQEIADLWRWQKMRFEGKNLERMREILAEQVAKADQWNHYSKADVEKYLGEVNGHLATATEQEMSAASSRWLRREKSLNMCPSRSKVRLNC